MDVLEHLGLVAKVTTELSNHWNITDKDVAAFIIHLGEQSDSLESFVENLSENGAEAAPDLAHKLYALICKLSSAKRRKEQGARESKVLQKDDNSDAKKAASTTSEGVTTAPLKSSNSSISTATTSSGRTHGAEGSYLTTHRDPEQTAVLQGRRSKFPGLAAADKPSRPELEFTVPQEDAPLSEHAQRLLHFEKDDKQLAEEAKEAARRGAQERRDRHSNGRRGDSDYNRGAPRSNEESRGHTEAPSRDGTNSNARRGGGRPTLVLQAIYDGRVSRLMDFGVFVQFDTAEGRKEGLVHVTDMSKNEGRVLNVRDRVSRNQEVKVKVIGLAMSKISLSMRDVDQATGDDLRPHGKGGATDATSDSAFSETGHNPEYGAVTGVKLHTADDGTRSDRQMKRRELTDLEIWEDQKMRFSGVLPREETLSYDPESGILPVEEVEEDVEVEVTEIEPPFLQGQTTRTGVLLSPIRIVANPDGCLARAAATSTALAKERREVKETQEKSLLDSIPKDMNRPWEDPNPEPGERTIAQALRGIGQTAYEAPEWKKLYIQKSLSYGQRSNRTMKEQRESLPIFKLRDALLAAVKESQVLVVIGETGSGKTTQMPQYLAEVGYCTNGLIGCTQPRRVAAMSVAKRVAEEFGCRLGLEVGYSIRFEECTSPDTMIKYMTDGMLLREALIDPRLQRYSLIMLDEAHERTISTDVLFGLLKACCQARPEFKVIVTSATLDAEKFSDYFFGAHIFTIPGRTFPVEIFYTKEPEIDYVEAALITVLQIHLCEAAGDVLVFLTGQEEIDTACQTLHERMRKLEAMNPPPLIILPVYSSLPSEMQTMIFDPAPPGCRKCVVATNIAEASLTIDGIYFVIDPGFAKMKMYNPKTGMDSLVVAPISQANARQRSGRAGRTGPGKCYRLYTEDGYRKEMLPTAVPEIQRANLANTVLVLKAMGVNDLLGFDFMDPPPVQTLINALEHLFELSALDEEGLMTRLGRKMAEFPMEPALSRMLLTSVDLKCSDEAITIVAMLQVQNVFYRPRDKQALADQKKSKFHQPEGDHLTYLEVYKSWQRNRFSNAWCYENFVQARALRRAQDVRKQLITIMDRYKLELLSSGKDYKVVRKAVCAGYFRNACRKDPQEGYRTVVDNQQVYMHPSSAVYNKSPEFVVYHELVLTTKEYIRDCCSIEPAWLTELAPSLFKKADDTKLSRRKQRLRIEPLYNRFEEPNAWRLSKRRG
eukprot:Lankesteria_metandrocarpae@DN6068_c0_g1_i1.p1